MNENKQIQIIARTDGFRRGGISHSCQPKVFNASDFSAEQLTQILNEPELIVSLAEAEKQQVQIPENALKLVVTAIEELEKDGTNINVANLTEKVGFKVSGELKDKALAQKSGK